MEVAKLVTGINDTDTAVTEFRQKLNSSESYFNPEPIPKNESDKEAHRKCSDIEGAKKYCPKRWAALELWMAESRKVGFIEFITIVNFLLSRASIAFESIYMAMLTTTVPRVEKSQWADGQLIFCRIIGPLIPVGRFHFLSHISFFQIFSSFHCQVTIFHMLFHTNFSEVTMI